MFRVRRSKYPLLVAAVSAALPAWSFAQTGTWTYGPNQSWSATWNDTATIKPWSPNTTFPNSPTSIAIFPAGGSGSLAGTGGINGGNGTVVINNLAITVGSIAFYGNGTNGLSNAYLLSHPTANPHGFIVTGAGANASLNINPDGASGGGTINVNFVGNDGAATVTTLPGTATISASLRMASGTLYKTGVGTLVLSGSNSFGGGAMSINDGVVKVTQTAALNGLQIITTANSGMLELSNASQSGSLTFAGLGSSTPPANGVIYSSAGNNSWNGAWFILQQASVGVAATSTLTVNGPIIDSANSGINGLTKLNSGTFVVNNLTLNGPVNVAGGVLKIKQNGGSLGTSRTSSLSIAGGATPTAALDLTDNDLVIDYTGSSPLAEVKAQIKSGFNAGAWTGNGIRTSLGGLIGAGSFSGKNARLGYAEASAVGLTSSFSGQPTDSSSVLVKYTFAGDANLDGDVDLTDIGPWSINFTGELGGTGPKFWNEGDWDYDGDVDLTDVGVWSINFTGELGGGGLGPILLPASAQLGAISALEGLGYTVTVVPEPTSVGLTILTAAGLVARRRRQR